MKLQKVFSSEQQIQQKMLRRFNISTKISYNNCSSSSLRFNSCDSGNCGTGGCGGSKFKKSAWEGGGESNANGDNKRVYDEHAMYLKVRNGLVSTARGALYFALFMEFYKPSVLLK